MNNAEAQRQIAERIQVTPQMVMVAKALILDKSAGATRWRSGELIMHVLSTHSVSMPERIWLHPSIEAGPVMKAAAEFLTWQLAAAEALWSLINNTLLVPGGTLEERNAPSLPWTEGVPGGSTTSSSFSFDNHFLPVPTFVYRAPSATSATTFLSDGDLFLNALNIPNMHSDIESALREAVRCFRQELYTAAVAMIGKASEGAWLELGGALMHKVPPTMHSSVKKQREILEDPNAGPMRKIQAVIALYERSDIFSTIIEAAGIRRQELVSAGAWSDIVRDSRNTIHFGVAPATPNTNDKVAVLLLGVSPHMRVLYKLKAAAEAS